MNFYSQSFWKIECVTFELAWNMPLQDLCLPPALKIRDRLPESVTSYWFFTVMWAWEECDRSVTKSFLLPFCLPSLCRVKLCYPSLPTTVELPPPSMSKWACACREVCTEVKLKQHHRGKNQCSEISVLSRRGRDTLVHLNERMATQRNIKRVAICKPGKASE